MTNPKGTQAETAVVRYARLAGFPGADRLTKTGAKDRGDVGLCPGVIVEVKNLLTAGKRGPTPAQMVDWMNQTEKERSNAGAELGILIVKREGTTDVGRWWAFLPVDDLVRLVTGKGSTLMRANEYMGIPVSLPVRELLQLLRFGGYGEPLA